MNVLIEIEAGCDPAPVFEAAEHALDDVALFVDGRVAIELDFNDDIGSTIVEPSTHTISVSISYKF